LPATSDLSSNGGQTYALPNSHSPADFLSRDFATGYLRSEADRATDSAGRRLTLSASHVVYKDGRTVDRLNGQHQRGEQTIKLSGFTVKKGLRPRRSKRQSQGTTPTFSKISMASSAFTSNPQDQNPVMVQDGYDPGYDYYAYNEMIRADGTPIAEAVYEYQSAYNQNNLYLTVGGVTLTFNVATEEVAPISDSDEAQLDSWGSSDDASIVRDTCVAIIEDGPNQYHRSC